ncbi:hypothetical protein CALVIDRAFT_342796 [Calocera viscosa TUFC12733]|uniref:Uncharacterized protein n=1 Tax=Calocera viscosa (strain TUFC12733) TaxID=1330018 RepID=A0A167HFB3_CALVF|nr:hypothetical protein CALVIDRAFT_342796 [Calocera viscosa TUFC12733]
MKLAGMTQSSDLLRMQVISLMQKVASEARDDAQGDKRPAEPEPIEAPAKKKKKKNSSPPSSTSAEESGRHLSKLESILELQSATSTADASDSHEVLSILRGIQVLVVSRNPDLELLRRSLQHGLERIALVLSELIKYHSAETSSRLLPTGIPPPTSHVALISSISGLVNVLLGHIAALFRDDSLPFAHLVVDKLLSPITCSIPALTRGFLARSLVMKEDTSSLVDIRPAFLDMISNALSVSTINMAQVACRQVALDSVRELERMFTPEHTSLTSPSLRRKHRQERLVRKDAVPHLCAILRLALSSDRETMLDSMPPRSVYMASTTFDKLSSLQFNLFSRAAAEDDDNPLSNRSELGVMADEVLLSVIEFAWMCCPLDDRVEEQLTENEETRMQEDTRVQGETPIVGESQPLGETQMLGETQREDTQASWWGIVMG